MPLITILKKNNSISVDSSSIDYDPRKDKDEGGYCRLCPPENIDCMETMEIKKCVFNNEGKLICERSN